VTLTLTLDPAIRHTVVHHSSTSTYIPNFIQIEGTFCGRTDGRTFFPSNIIRSNFGSRPNKTRSRQNRLGQVRVTDYNRLTTSCTTSSLVVQLVCQPGCRYEPYSQPRLATSWQLVANQLAKWNLAFIHWHEILLLVISK